MRDFLCWVEALADTSSCPPALKDLLLRMHTTAVSAPMKGGFGSVDLISSPARPVVPSSRVSVRTTIQDRASPAHGRDARPRR